MRLRVLVRSTHNAKSANLIGRGSGTRRWDTPHRTRTRVAGDTLAPWRIFFRRSFATLYHYTTAEGVLGILGTQSIRATNFSFLNDATEVSYGLRIIDTVMGKLARETRLALGDVREALRSYAALADTYVACFSERPDDLSQWRGYGASEVDRFCLGFDRSVIRQLQPGAAARTAGSTRFSEVVYDPDLQERMTESLLADMLGLTGVSNAPRSPWSIAFKLLELASTFKDPAFGAEAEWRAVVSNLNRSEMALQFVVRGGRLRPFVPLYMTPAGARLPLRAVILLPFGRADQAIKAAELLLLQHGYSRELLRVSSIPFVG